MDEASAPVHDPYSVLNTSTRLDDRNRVLKHGDTFAVLDRYGNVEPFGRNEFGVFHHDTRFLSLLVLRLQLGDLPAARLRLLSSAVKDDNPILTVHLTNPDLGPDTPGGMAQGTVHLLRTQALWRSTLFDKVRVHNYGERSVTFALTLALGADFADIFEVRGMDRAQHGQRLGPEIAAGRLRLAYRGLDERLRQTSIRFDPPPDALHPGQASFEITLAPHAAQTLQWTVNCDDDEPAAAASAPAGYDAAEREVQAELAATRASEARLDTSHAQFNEFIDRARADLYLLSTDTAHGAYPYAGVPWFSAPFGRDGIITALQCLWLAPDLPRGVLGLLAATQATGEDDARDAQPGKILHEARGGEMAALGEVPFGRYYGSVDATPLFVVLACAHHKRTGDTDFVRSIWPNIELALRWIDDFGDVDGDGFVEYARQTPRGLVNQGWKDSHDSIFHEDGSAAEPPIALCEVQGYVYAARRMGAQLARALQRHAEAATLDEQAEALRRRFEDAFWCEDLSTYALALDGGKRPCRVRTSNAGHCLFTGIANAERAQRVAQTLMSESGYSGWGVRTVHSTSTRYNPMSYHNGSVWPHDNALIAAGFARYGLQPLAARILSGLFEASLLVDLRRLPELFCGFARGAGDNPTLYPQACSPQAWAAGAPLLCLQACLGLEIDAARNTVTLHRPFLPEFLHRICIEGLQVRDTHIDFEVTRHAHDVGARLLRREGEVRFVVEI